MSGEILKIDIRRIVDPHTPMRTGLEMEGIVQLSESIKQHGLINPITVRPVQKDEFGASVPLASGGWNGASDETCLFEVVAGHRRITACRLAALSEVPCVVRCLTEDEVIGIMAGENLEREDVNPVEEAMMIGRYVGEDETKIPEIARKMNRSMQWVRDRLAILEFPDYLVAAIGAGRIQLGVAKWLGAIEDETYRRMFVDQATRDGMKTLQAEYLYNQWKGGLFKPAEDLLQESAEIPAAERPRARAQCARCGRLAVEPNLQNVFIHMECPPEEAQHQPADVAAHGGAGIPGNEQPL